MNFDEIVLEALRDEWVIILEFTLVGTDQEEETDSEITYTMKKVKDLTPEELEKIKTLDPFKGFARYKTAFSRTSDDGLPILAFFDTKKKVEWILWYYKQTGNKMSPKIELPKDVEPYWKGIVDEI
jgi:hypothetical protein